MNETPFFSVKNAARSPLFAPPRKIGLLARLSGRDPETLARCPQDEIGAAQMLGLSIGVAAAVHGASMAAALGVLNAPLPLALGLAATTATGLYALDRQNAASRDAALGERALGRIDAACAPPLVGGASRLFSSFGRLLFSLMTGVSLAGMIGLHFYDADLRQIVAEKQLRLDEPFVAAASASLAGERGGLEAALAEATRVYEDARQGEAAAAEARRARLDGRRAALQADESRIAALREAEQTARSDAVRQADLAECEIAGRGPECDAASGLSGDGPLHKLAKARAEAALTEGSRLAAEHARLRQAADREAEALRREAEAPPSRPDLTREAAGLEAARERLVRHDAGAGERTAAMVAADPARRLLDPSSLAERLKALGVLAAEPLSLAALLAAMIAATALELLGFLAAAMGRPGQYHLMRAAALDEEAGRLRNLAAAREAEDEATLVARADRRAVEADRAAAHALQGMALKAATRRARRRLFWGGDPFRPDPPEAREASGPSQTQGS